VRYQGVNRVYQISGADGDFLYVAPDPMAAVKFHGKHVGLKRAPKGVKPIELAADRILTVVFSDCAEAIHHITGGALPVDRIRESLKDVPLADEFISIRRAAEQWARTVRDGQSRLLRTSLS
jgi:hypothetical protein